MSLGCISNHTQEKEIEWERFEKRENGWLKRDLMNDHVVYACWILRNKELTPRRLFMVITFKVLFKKKKKKPCKVSP
jgi:hypothetical protein